ncbi:hypothetical protein ACFYXQ_33580 [Nocardia jiangxiensis]|uniref:Mce-associated membrane protein n=1 Tax=Nocardia jiangxiensis TaxID=282685 RepID=A0ABW6S8X5_9NOCA
MARVAYQSDNELRSEETAVDIPAADPGPDTEDAAPATEPVRERVRSKRSRRPGTAIIALVVLVVAVIALTTVTAVMLVDNRAISAHKQRDAAVLAAARRMVVDLTTLNRTSVEPDITRILAETTGSFRDQFTHQADTFRQVIGKGAVTSTGSVVESGLISADDGQAQVLVASTSTVQNSDAPNGQQRVYRMKVSVQHVGDEWLVSNVEFVS